MNNNELSSYQNVGNNNQPQSLIKLPIIFAVIMIVCSVLSIIINPYIINLVDSSKGLLSFTYEEILITTFIQSQYVMLYICIGFMLCVVQKRHQVTTKNILMMFIVCIIYVVVQKFFLLGYDQLHSSLEETSHLSYNNLQLLLTIIDLMSLILQSLILVGIFTFVGRFNRNQSASYIISTTNFRALFALLFTVIFFFPFLLFLACNLPSCLMTIMFRRMESLAFYTDDIRLVYLFIFIIPPCLTFLITLINFLIIYFSVKNCFIRQFTTIPFKLLFKSVGWAYLYLIGFSIVISIIYFFVILIIGATMNSYSLRSTAMILIMVSSIILSVISIVGSIKLTRKAVRKYFA